MACSVANNTPLKRLEAELNLPKRCHGRRAHCIKGFEAAPADSILGMPGTAIGYCQALFPRETSAKEHTKKVSRLLDEIQAPWANSHELFWGYKQDQSPAPYVNDATAPLVGVGRVPIIITGIDPATGAQDIDELIQTHPNLAPEETILFRIVLNDEVSVEAAAHLMRSILERARATRSMPRWWPLLQAQFGAHLWEKLAHLLGDDWQFANVGVNPFVPQDAFEFCFPQITVGQIVVGGVDDIASDGTISVPSSMPILGASDARRSYHLPSFVRMLMNEELLGGDRSGGILSPTVIVLGPCQDGWSDLVCQKRLSRLLPHLRDASDVLWSKLSVERRQAVWQMDA
ncbi:MAG: hypothetical protein IAE77_14070 [Prosthecobacter sp.]|jgi:hypothetical protein|uniref:hypothetical protein n=1 Tax=Prosthecobacter sp. TaxID=1965333 RepID=UPI0019EB0B52|nr:hypothetical protein [Prosthecobacter sp.]MBE2284579.1 hypothetical protein [Prosthecobacter sp.]